MLLAAFNTPLASASPLNLLRGNSDTTTSGNSTQTISNNLTSPANDTFVTLPATSNTTAGIFYVATAPGALGLRRLDTPWPLVVGKAIFSFVLFFFSAHPRDDEPLTTPSTLSFAAKYLLNMAQTVGAVVFLVKYLMHDGKLPSVGVVLALETFTVLRYPSELTVLLFVACLAIAAGGALFVASGALLLARHGANDGWGSVTVTVAQGCVGTINPSQTRCSAVAAPQVFMALTDDDRARAFLWGIGCFLAVLVVPTALGAMANPRKHFSEMDSPLFRQLPYTIMALGATAAVLEHALEGKATSADYWDCRNATLLTTGTHAGNWTGCVKQTIAFPGSASGFWDVWTQSKEAVTEGIFGW
jgi:hypothetical protein